MGTESTERRFGKGTIMRRGRYRNGTGMPVWMETLLIYANTVGMLGGVGTGKVWLDCHYRNARVSKRVEHSEWREGDKVDG